MMTTKELIERYIQEVGRHLPRKNRDDILKELTSLIYDTLEERVAGEEPTPEMTAKVLREFGQPKQFAAQYQPKRALIGPQLFPTYQLVITIVLGALSVANLVLLVLLVQQQFPEISASSVWGWFTGYLSSLVTGLGSTTLIFAAIEYFMGDELEDELLSTEADTKTAAWDPFSLPPINDPNRISRGDFVAEIVASAFFVTIFITLLSQEGLLAGFITPEFRTVFGWLVLSIGLELVLKMFVLGQGKWTNFTRWLDIGSELFGLFVLYHIVMLEAIVTIPPLNSIITFGISIAMVIVIISTLVKIAKLLLRRDPRPIVQMA